MRQDRRSFGYRFSPYLVERDPGDLSNLLTRKRIRISAEVWERVRALREPFTLEDVTAALSVSSDEITPFIGRLMEAEILLPDDSDPFDRYVVRFADIEITSHCNARCRFCPVSIAPLPRQVMSEEIFAMVLERLRPHPVEWVSLNHYNEPLLDPRFLEKARLLREHELPLRLFTNGVLLKPEIARRLQEMEIVELIVVNIPTDDPDLYRQKMGVRLSPHLIDHLRHASALGLPLNVCINGRRSAPDKEMRAWAERVNTVLGATVGVHMNLTHDRAGLVGGPEVTVAAHWSGPLGGCQRMLEHLHVNVEGRVFLCCQDYHQTHILGDLVKESVEEVMTGPRAVELRRKVFGAQPATDDFICRSCIELIRPDAALALSHELEATTLGGGAAS